MPLDSAQVLYRSSRFDEALPLFERAVADSPAHAVARCWLAETRRRIGRHPSNERPAPPGAVDRLRARIPYSVPPLTSISAATSM